MFPKPKLRVAYGEDIYVDGVVRNTRKQISKKNRHLAEGALAENFNEGEVVEGDAFCLFRQRGGR